MEIRYHWPVTTERRAMTLKEALERERGARNMSLHQIANAGGPSYKTLQRIAKGEVPTKSEVYERLDRVFAWKPGTARRLSGDGSTLALLTPESSGAALSTLATLRNVIPENAKTEAVTTLLDLLHEQISKLSE